MALASYTYTWSSKERGGLDNTTGVRLTNAYVLVDIVICSRRFNSALKYVTKAPLALRCFVFDQ
jgi:hypothetical protein